MYGIDLAELHVEGSLEGRIVRNGGRYEVLRGGTENGLELRFVSNHVSPRETIAVVLMEEAYQRVKTSDAQSHTALMEAQIAFLEKELSSTRTMLLGEMEKRLETQKEASTYLEKLKESQRMVAKREKGEEEMWPFPRHLKSHVRPELAVPGPNVNIKKFTYGEWSKMGYDPVLVACMFGESERIEWLVRSGASLLFTGHRGETCVYLASEFGHLDTLKWLLARLTVQTALQIEEAEHVLSARNNPRFLKTTSTFSLQSVVPLLPLSSRLRSGKAVSNKVLLKTIRNQRHLKNGLSSIGVACANGHSFVVEWMLSNGWDCHELMPTPTQNDSIYNENDTLLHIAAKHGQNSVIEILIKSGSHLASARNDIGETALHSATRFGQRDTSKLLLKFGLHPTAKDHFGLTSFLTAIAFGHLDLAKLFLDYSHQSSSSTNNSSSIRHNHLEDKDADGSSAFILSCFKGFLPIAQFLLDQGADINDSNFSGNTALSVACFQGDSKVVKFLLSRLGKSEDFEYSSSLSSTVPKTPQDNQNGSPKTAWKHSSTTHLNRSGDVPSNSLNSSSNSLNRSQQSISRPNVETSQGLNVVNSAGNTPMILAAYGGHVEVMEMLSTYGAKISSRNKVGSTALLISAMYGHKEATEWCLLKGASMEEKDKIGVTPFIAACMSGNLSVVDLLLERGACIHETTNEKFSALHMAAYCGCADTVKQLLDFGLSPSAAVSNGATALMLAALNGHMETLHVLISHGMTVNDRLRAASLAERNGFSDIADYLRTRAYSRSAAASSSATSIVITSSS